MAVKRQFELLIETMKERKVDALALCDDEGRNSLRKASVRWQVTFDPKISEWGNPAA